MKILFLTEMYSEGMGYSENFLPKAMARLGHEVHVVSSTAQVYFNAPHYRKTYEPFLGPNIVQPGTKEIDGYLLHRLPLILAGRISKKLPGMNVIMMKGLRETIAHIHPDVINVFHLYSQTCYEAARVAHELNTDRAGRVRFFTESHVHASVFNMRNPRTWLKYHLLQFPRKLRFINSITVKHYAIAKDVAEISMRYFLVPPEKIEIESLGVDTDLFSPIASAQDEQARRQKRKALGFEDTDIVCIYTGRFTPDKNPLCLAQAVNYLHEKGTAYQHIKALFVGSGTQRDVEAIRAMKGCVVHPFVQVHELPALYRAADIGVWPRQESTSQLDAAACGLPIIISNRTQVKERVDPCEGMPGRNGLLYEENNFVDLAEKILMLSDPQVRKEMGRIGAQKVHMLFSWDAIARKREKDFQHSLET
ncbi:glycosyltransferase involved in cell wall biosynthesis [Thermoflavifilum aggregans]|uniref:Glycosyltransferase involved in cell wall biosynthesis n=1 Tax=Thermoflavifilum aggregans TaxID=454188 RepID=A0A2M9CUM6_9BACT|nr:glycosyltransferase family 4 protein [Thermoflavifilum aggregans]PJJ75617.1 glycosyltransferase involved in cell wall biosynthesis [Thermoflavifilum aggregans]